MKITALGLCFLCFSLFGSPRDPFFLTKTHGSSVVTDGLILRGIINVRGKKAALVSCGNVTNVSYKNDFIGKSLLKEINDDYIVLVCKNKQTKIYIS
jgi:hypothetical protein